MVVVDKSDPNKSYVVMDINEYEYLIKKDEPWMDGEMDDDNDENWEELEEDFNDHEDFNDGEDDNYNSEFSDFSEDDQDMDEFYNQYNQKESKEQAEDISTMSYKDITPNAGNEGKSPIIDDFYLSDDKFSQFSQEKGQKLDNNAEYGKMNYEFSEEKTDSRSNKWRIPKYIKEAGQPEISAGKGEDDDRYYLETI